MLDHFGSSMFSCKPSAIVTYSPGPWGGRHAAIALQPILHELGCLPVSAMFGMSGPAKLLTPAGEPTSDDPVRRFERVVVQLEWMGQAMRRQRELHGVLK